MAKEVWKAIPGYPHYEASSLGRIKSLRKNIILKSCHVGRNYYGVSMPKGRTSTVVRVHKLVLLAFVGPRPEGYVAAHLNGNPSDNRIANLNWVTPKENSLHMYKHGTVMKGEKAPANKLKEYQVLEIRSRLTESQEVLAKEFGVSQSTIQDIKHRRTWAWL